MMTGQYDGQGGAQQAIIGSREVEGCSETGVGDAIAVTAGDALDRAVEAYAAKMNRSSPRARSSRGVRPERAAR